MRRIAQQLFTIVILVYVVTFLLWRLLVASPLYNALWWLQVSEIFGMAVYLPAALLLPGAFALCNRKALLGIAIPLIWLGVEYGQLFLPNSSSQTADDEIATLRVMTWNTANTIGYEWGDVSELHEVAAKAQPDIILLQEVGPDALQQLDALAGEWPYQTAGIAGQRARLAIASKWQILSEEIDDELRGCHCLRVTLAWHDRPVDVMNVHVEVPTYDMYRWHGFPALRGFEASYQNLTFERLRADFVSAQHPVLMAGDFNTTERQPNYTLLLNGGLRDAHDESGWGFGLTFPRPGAIRRWWLLPLLRIDHILYGESWTATRTWTGIMPSSDHLYVMADLQLREP
jgi:vancomycin resistance protein VanJ